MDLSSTLEFLLEVCSPLGQLHGYKQDMAHCRYERNISHKGYIDNEMLERISEMTVLCYASNGFYIKPQET